MKKTIYTAMKDYVEKTLTDAPLKLVSLSAETSTDKTTGEITNYIRVEADVPTGYDSLSRCRISVKIINAVLKISEEQADADDYCVTFKNLTISYIDAKGSVYFKSDDYNLKVVS